MSFGKILQFPAFRAQSQLCSSNTWKVRAIWRQELYSPVQPRFFNHVLLQHLVVYIFESHWLSRNAKSKWGLESPWNFLHFERNRSSVAQILWKIEVFKQKNHKWCPSSCKLIFPIKILGVVFKQLYLLKFSSYRVGIARKMKGISRAFQISHSFYAYI